MAPTTLLQKMKAYILLVTLQLIIFCRWSSASGVEQKKSSVMAIKRSLYDLWSWLWRKEGEDSFVGRCLGAARKLKFVMPLIVFKLGVIVTTLGFLTVFALKSLGLLILLLFINSAKIAHKDVGLPSPQNVHFHVHPKDGHYGDYGHGWYDKEDYGDDYDSLKERLKRLNIYESYRKY